MSKKMIVNIVGIVLCISFFALPLVQCSQDSSINATALQISTGTGELMDNADTSYPYVFILLVLPLVLVALGFLKKPFTTLRNVSIGGLAAQVIFIVAAYIMLNTGNGDFNGAFTLTPFCWLILAVYIGLVIFTQICIKQEPEKPN